MDHVCYFLLLFVELNSGVFCASEQIVVVCDTPLYVFDFTSTRNARLCVRGLEPKEKKKQWKRKKKVTCCSCSGGYVWNLSFDKSLATVMIM